jgi:hypothetical protein
LGRVSKRKEMHLNHSRGWNHDMQGLSSGSIEAIEAAVERKATAMESKKHRRLDKDIATGTAQENTSDAEEDIFFETVSQGKRE